MSTLKVGTIAHLNGTTAMTIATDGGVTGAVKKFTSAE